MQIKGNVVLITGASQGIGAACADAFRRRGARLALVARTREKLERVAGPDGLSLPGDVTDAEFRRRAVAETLARYGRIDILINNAGIGLFAPAWSAPIDDVRAMVEVNFFAALAMTQLVVPQMRARRSGMIVNVGSIAGRVTLPWLSLYSATKFALASMTDGLRMELSPDNIKTMLVCPGYVDTDFQDNALAGKPPEKIRNSKTLLISPERCAEDIARGVEKEQRTVVTPGSGRWFILARHLLPGVVDAQLARIYHSL
jgi:short-subunit dehydrogenase